ncbi:MAG TPA: hypothetical protein PLR83_00215 [Pyrinomonadaceae bacterium]|nr:hypothetical protein [Pyrinomonadaceae bacterium]
MQGTEVEPNRFLPEETVEEEIINPASSVGLSNIEIVVVGRLLRATTTEPVKQRELIAEVTRESQTLLTNRTVRLMIRRFRRERGFPICSRKGFPAGYWWGRTEPEVEEFAKVFFAQIKDEASTVAIMLKKNYPRLAGQMTLDFVEEKTK